MKKILLKSIAFVCVCLLANENMKAQNVAINASGAAPNASAMLDITSTTTGLLIPRMTSAQRTAIGAPATGLLVYDTTTGSFWYYNGTIWIQILNTNTGWSTTGNAGTVVATNFLGTTDAVDFAIRTNNTERMRILSGGNVGIGMVPGVKLDVTGAGSGTIDFRVNGRIQTGDAGGNGGMWLSNASDGFIGNNGGNIGFWTNGAGWNAFQIVKATGQVAVNTTTPIAGDLFSSFGNAAQPYAINGYTTGNGVAVYGYRNTGTTGTWGSIQGELITTAPNNSNGVSGLVNNTNHRGVTGQKPVGGAQWGGLFLNDLGYTGFFGAASDERFKKDITKIDDALEKLLKLKTYKYHYTEPELGGDKIFYYGFMAQDVEILFPDLVQEKDFTPSQAKSFYNGYDKNLKLKAVSTISLIPILTKALQEQQEIIESQKQELENLKTQTSDLLIRIEKLEKK